MLVRRGYACSCRDTQVEFVFEGLCDPLHTVRAGIASTPLQTLAFVSLDTKSAQHNSAQTKHTETRFNAWLNKVAVL